MVAFITAVSASSLLVTFGFGWVARAVRFESQMPIATQGLVSRNQDATLKVPQLHTKYSGIVLRARVTAVAFASAGVSHTMIDLASYRPYLPRRSGGCNEFDSCPSLHAVAAVGRYEMVAGGLKRRPAQSNTGKQFVVSIDGLDPQWTD